MPAKLSSAADLNCATGRRRLALLIHSLQGGGAERLISLLANRWSSLHEVHLITWSKIGTDHYRLEAAVVRHGLDLQTASGGLISGVFANLLRLRELRKVLRQLNPDLVLSFCDQMNIVCLEATRAMPQTPVYIAEHSDPGKQRLSPLWEAWRKRNYPRCSGCIVLTESIKQQISQLVPLAKLRVIPSSVQTSSTASPVYVDTPSNGMNSILFLGRLSQEKRVGLLLEAWKRLAPQLSDWQLLIVGDGPMRSELEQQAGQTQRVKFLGWQVHPETILTSSQLFVLCSRYEGFPMALLEALYHGLPAIVTNCSSAIDQLQAAKIDSMRFENGGPAAFSKSETTSSLEAIEIIPVESVDSLVQAIEGLARDPQRRKCMSRQAQLVAQRFTWEKVAKLWDAILLEN